MPGPLPANSGCSCRFPRKQCHGINLFVFMQQQTATWAGVEVCASGPCATLLLLGLSFTVSSFYFLPQKHKLILRHWDRKNTPRPSHPNSLSAQLMPPLNHVPSCYILNPSGVGWGGELHCCSEQSVPWLYNTSHEKIFPNIQSKSYLVQLEVALSCRNK